MPPIEIDYGEKKFIVGSGQFKRFHFSTGNPTVLIDVDSKLDGGDVIITRTDCQPKKTDINLSAGQEDQSQEVGGQPIVLKGL
jgi:hypothetical protein